MVAPLVLTGIEEPDRSARGRIGDANAFSLALVAIATREPKVAPRRPSAESFGFEVHDFHEGADNVFLAQALAAAVPRVPGDLSTKLGCDGRFAHGAINSETSTPRLCNSANAVARTTIDFS